MTEHTPSHAHASSHLHDHAGSSVVAAGLAPSLLRLSLPARLAIAGTAAAAIWLAVFWVI